MLKIALVALALLVPWMLPVAAQEVTREALALPPNFREILRADWYKRFRQKVEMLRRLHEPGVHVSWLQQNVYLSIVEAVINQGLNLDELNTSLDELEALTYGGEIV
ncbi:MAG: hypothetical protein AAB919_00535 [Patescibacteria group bacterium]